MRRDELGDLSVFLTVAEERSFTRAAAKLATSQSALSQTVRRLEERLGIRLLVRNTRNVSPTEAGEQLIETLRPALSDIDARLTALGQFRDQPAGTVRLTAGQHASDTILWRALEKVMLQYPDIKVELSLDSGLTDIVTERFDAGVRLGEQVAKDMIAVRIGPDIRMAVVGSPSYFSGRTVPLAPHDLTRHSCVNLRLPSAGGLYAWEFSKNGRDLHVRVDGQLVVNNVNANLKAAIAGIGLAIVMEDQIPTLVSEGKLVRILEDWCPPFAGYYIYYPSRRQLSPAFRVVLDALKYRA
jgi:DNA-binding transcriptional LysR family regulator